MFAEDVFADSGCVTCIPVVPSEDIPETSIYNCNDLLHHLNKKQPHRKTQRDLKIGDHSRTKISDICDQGSSSVNS